MFKAMRSLSSHLALSCNIVVIKHLLAIVILCCFAIPVFAASVGGNNTKHTIIEVQDLIETAISATWSNQREEQLSLGVQDAMGGLVENGIKKGGINGFLNKYGERYFDPKVEAKTIDVNLEPTMGRNDTEIRGAYSINVPDMKNIQLETMYDILVDEYGNKGKADFWFEIYELEKDGSWKFLDKIENPSKNSPASLVRNQVEDEIFNTYGVRLNLSEVRGKTIQLVLVSHSSKDSIVTQKGRWTRLKLIASTFKVKLGDPTKVVQPETTKTNFSTQDWIDEDLGTAETISITGISSYPDGAIAIVPWNSKTYGYTHVEKNASSHGTGIFEIDSPH